MEGLYRIRPGPPTADYLDFVLTRLTAIGALYLSAVCMLQNFDLKIFDTVLFWGTSLLIVVTVAIDTVTGFVSYVKLINIQG